MVLRTKANDGTKAVATDPVRTAVRFPMALALSIVTETGELQAVTEDISSNGILFTGEVLPPLDSRIEFTITMPAAVMGTAEDLAIHCIGRVIRHQRSGDRKQAAAIIDEYFLRV